MGPGVSFHSHPLRQMLPEVLWVYPGTLTKEEMWCIDGKLGFCYWNVKSKHPKICLNWSTLLILLGRGDLLSTTYTWYSLVISEIFRAYSSNFCPRRQMLVSRPSTRVLGWEGQRQECWCKCWSYPSYYFIRTMYFWMILSFLLMFPWRGNQSVQLSWLGRYDWVPSLLLLFFGSTWFQEHTRYSVLGHSMSFTLAAMTFM